MMYIVNKTYRHVQYVKYIIFHFHRNWVDSSEDHHEWKIRLNITSHGFLVLTLARRVIMWNFSKNQLQFI